MSGQTRSSGYSFANTISIQRDRPLAVCVAQAATNITDVHHRKSIRNLQLKVLVARRCVTLGESERLAVDDDGRGRPFVWRRRPTTLVLHSPAGRKRRHGRYFFGRNRNRNRCWCWCWFRNRRRFSLGDYGRLIQTNLPTPAQRLIDLNQSKCDVAARPGQLVLLSGKEVGSHERLIEVELHVLTERHDFVRRDFRLFCTLGQLQRLLLRSQKEDDAVFDFPAGEKNRVLIIDRRRLEERVLHTNPVAQPPVIENVPANVRADVSKKAFDEKRSEKFSASYPIDPSRLNRG